MNRNRGVFVPSQSGRSIIFNGVHRKNSSGEIFGGSSDPAPIWTPIQRNNVGMALSIRAVQLHWGYCFFNARPFPNLHEAAHRCGNKIAIRAEHGAADGGFEGEMMEKRAATTVDDQCSAIFVDGKEEAAVGGDANSAHVFSVFKGQR